MRNALLGFASLAALAAFPTLASAEGGAATGAATGAVTGAIVGGPVGAVVGGAAGAAVGGAADTNRSTTVVREAPAPTTSERTCVRDAAGNETCRETVR